ncbi:MAG TPA: SSI family serine proteinase inhibitor [Streptosporangiaceae bacterium]
MITAAGSTSAPAGPAHHPRRRRPRAQLWISVRQAPHGPVLRWTLRCGPDGGRLPHPSRACARLGLAQRPFAPVPHGIVCPMIDYGPQTARITGLWHGAWITARFSRANGCEETRWNKVIVALGLGGVPGRVNPGGPMQPAPPGPARVNPGGPMRPAPPGPAQVNPGGPMR